eukprot:4788392-Prymnesium_polylepis.3
MPTAHTAHGAIGTGARRPRHARSRVLRARKVEASSFGGKVEREGSLGTDTRLPQPLARLHVVPGGLGLSCAALGRQSHARHRICMHQGALRRKVGRAAPRPSRKEEPDQLLKALLIVRALPATEHAFGSLEMNHSCAFCRLERLTSLRI